MRKVFLVFLLSTAAWAQQQGNSPEPTDALINTTSTGNTAHTIVVPEPLLSGDTVIIAYSQDAHSPGGSPNCGPGPYAISDSSGNSWTTYSSTLTPDPGSAFSSQMSCSVITNAGSDTITLTPTATICTHQLLYHRFPASQNVTCTLDGGQQVTTVNHNTTPSVQTVSTSNTTLFNGSPIVTMTACSGCINVQPVNTQTIATNTSAFYTSLHVMDTGIAGSYTASLNYLDGHLAIAMASVALKVSAISITTTALADCAAGTTCVQHLAATGGSGPYTWSVTSGSVPGMAMTDTVNGYFTDTGSGPTSQGSYSVTFHVTDGTVSANATLTQVVGQNFLTPALLQTNFSNSFNNGGATFSPFGAPVNCGDSVLMMMHAAADNDFGQGYLVSLSGINNYYSATVGGVSTPVTRVFPFSGSIRGPDYGILFGPFTSAGTFTVSGFNSHGESSALNLGFYHVSNVQAVIDSSVFNGKTVVSDGTIAASATTLEPNEFVAVAASAQQGPTASIASPFTFDDVESTAGGIFGHAIIASPSSITATTTITSHQGCSPNCQDAYQTYIVALRPRLPVAACGEPAPGPRHRTDLK